ncbi:glutamate ABC transporter substrate-binding protein [Streptomyces sp. TRM66268-LWL]|uniref:Glutamate ABC transporter substrate-binding protein n=2 Tax=Streptomyces polyasparticus TaxID=2767826 RepID=A0ABR7SRD9_9ACTN|nr:glutamate ABC transporter substrate-binding protein [Streptomyces polyasparticus]
MALACVLTAAFALLPLPRVSDSPSGVGGQGVADARQALAPDAVACDDKEPEVSLGPSPDAGAKIQEINSRTDKPKGKLVVGIDQNSYLWGYRNPNTGELEGFDIDLATAIAKAIFGTSEDDKGVERVNIVFRAVPTNQRIPMIKSGQVDMIVRTMTISCKRKADVAFSTAYFATGQQVLAPETSKITGFDSSLEGKKLCVASGSTAQGALEDNDHGADEPLVVANQLDCLVRLQLGEVDGVVTDSALAAGQAAQDPTVKLKGKPLATEYYGIAMSNDPKAEDLVRRVNYELDKWRKDPNGWQKSYGKWLADDLGAATPPKPKYSD